MFKLDNEFLTSLGLGGIPVDEKNRLLQMIYERLEMNVGMRLAEKMTDQQLDEFEGFIDRNDEGGALKWLETNFPNYKDVVAEELEKLKVEVQAAAPQILAASQVTNMPGANPAPMPQPGFQPGMPQTGQMGPPPMPGQPPMQPGQPMQPFPQPPQPQPQFGPQPMPMQQPPVAPAPPQPSFSQPAPSAAPAPQFSQPAPAPAPQPQFNPQPQSQPQPPAVFQPAPGVQQAPGQQPAQSQQFTPPPAGFTPPQQ